MYKKLIRHWQPLPRVFKVVIVIILLLGLVFRFSNLENRPYWHDETYTMLRTSGYTVLDVTHGIFDGRIVSRDDVLKYQQITPDKTWRDALYSTMFEEPQRTPLYYIIVRWWRQWFGESIATARLLSVLLSLLIFPSLYWFCLELFAQPLTAWIALALISVSPFHVHYAQEVREYSLWTAMLLLMNAALLRSLRIGTTKAWYLYAITVALSFYTFILTGFIAIAHLVYVGAIEGWRRTEKSIAFLKAFMLGFGIFLPWLLFGMIHFSQIEDTSAWMNHVIPLPSLVEQWFGNLEFIFFRERFTRLWQWLIAFTIAGIIGVSGFVLGRRTQKNTWLLIAALVLFPFLGLAVPDVVSGGIRSTNSRYLVPSILGIQITVAFFLSTHLIRSNQQWWRQLQWRFVTLLLVTIGVGSCWLQTTRLPKNDDQQIAALINQATPAIVVSNEESVRGGGTIGDVLVLSHLVNPQTQFQLVIKPNVPIIPPHSTIFLYKPFDLLRQQLRSQCEPKPIYQDKLFSCQSSK